MNKEMQLLNDFKLYLQDKSNIAFCTKFYTEKYKLFTTDDVVNAIEKIQHQLEEKDKAIDEVKKYCKSKSKFNCFGDSLTEKVLNTYVNATKKDILEILERGKNVNSK